MQKIVIDTNVFVSGLIQRSYPHLIIQELFVNEGIELCISQELLQEYYLVFGRKKFSKYPDFVRNAEILIADIEAKSKKFSPSKKLNIVADQDDNKFLELAETCKANFLITGNRNDFTMKKHRQTRIVTPKEYWDNFKQ